jgi:hypothetical protein
MTAYAYSILTSRSFEIQITYPCELEKLLSPNKIDWRIKHQESSSMISLDKRNDENFVNQLKTLNLFEFLNETSLLRIKTNYVWLKAFAANKLLSAKLNQLGYDSASFGLKRQLHKWYNDLFKLSPGLQRIYDQVLLKYGFKEGEGQKLICAQVRIGGPRPHVSNDLKFYDRSVTKLFWNFINQTFIQSLEEKHMVSYKLFIASDTESVVEEAEKVFGANRLIKMPGLFTHVDKTYRFFNDCEPVQKTFLDFHFMQNCEYSVVSTSGYGMLSGINRPDPFLNFYLFDGKKFIKITETNLIEVSTGFGLKN